MLMRRHHFLALALIVLAVLIAAITFKARKATGQTVEVPAQVLYLWIAKQSAMGWFPPALSL